jgi:Tol biopolymer transport system component
MNHSKLLLAGALILVSVVTASAQPRSAAGDDVIAFVSERDGNAEIYVMNVDGPGLLRLTNDGGRDADPAWSPDGKRIAFASDRAGSWDIYVMNANGSNLVRRTATGRNEAPAWSPDGRTVAFSSLRGGQVGIYVMSVDGDWASPMRLGFDRGWNTHPAWSPDGRQIAFVSDSRAFDILYDVYVMNADGSGITSKLAGPFFIRDGQVFYFQPSWSPDGEQMAVVVCPYACYPGSSIAIARGDRLTTLVEAGGYAKPAWSPDGGTIAFSSQACRTCAASLRYVSTDGTRTGLIFSNGHSAAWRPAVVVPDR